MRVMRILAIFLACFAVCSCASHPTVRLGVGDDPTWVSQHDAGILAQEFVAKKGYPKATCLSAEVAGQHCQYVFETSYSGSRVLVFVDRKTRKVRFEEITH